MKTSTKFFTITLSVSLVVLAAIATQSIVRMKAMPRYESYNAKTVRTGWAKTEFAAISSPEFAPAKLAALVSTAETAATPPPHYQAAAELVTRWAHALNGGSFDEFWNFRVPTGDYRAMEGTDASMARLIEDGMAMTGARTSDAGGGAATSTKDRWRQFWGLVDGMRTETLVQFAKGKGHKAVRPCTRCLKGFDLKSLEIGRWPDAENPPNLREIAMQRPNVGTIFAKGIVEALPTFADLKKSASPDFHFVLIAFKIQLENDAVTPVYMTAYWYAEKGCYIPYQMAAGDSSAKGLKLMF